MPIIEEPAARRDRFLAAYDAQLRTEAEVRSARTVTRIGPLWLAAWERSCGFVTYRSLEGMDEAGVRALVGRALARFAADPDIEEVEWKTRAHDAAPGLAQALADAGFEAEPPESIMVGEAALLAQDLALPDGVTLRRITAERDIRAMAEMESRVFHDDSYVARVPQLVDEARDGQDVELWVAEARLPDGGAQMVCAGRLEPVAGTDFAGLWGGGTLAEWRGRGIYRALTAARARSALARGKTLLNADCTEMSRPILERSGLVKVSETTPWTWRRPGRERAADGGEP